MASFLTRFPLQISDLINFHLANYRSTHGTIIRNADFQASDQNFKIYDSRGVSTLTRCAAQCMANDNCRTAVHVKLQQRCSLFSELLSMGTIESTSVDSAVISFEMTGL